MSDQLHLLDSSSRWRLDRATRERGRNGVATAREILRRARGGAPATESEAGPQVAPEPTLADAA